MLTPQEAANTTFEKAFMGGYVMDPVDKFVTQLSQDYATLYRENAKLKEKMKVLVDTVEEYRSTEDAMRKAFTQAERAAKEITDAAEARRDAIDAEASQTRAELMAKLREEAESRKAQYREELAVEEAALDRARRLTAAYVDKLRSAMSAYREAMENIYGFVEPLPPAEEAPAEEPEEEAAAPVPEEDAVPEDEVPSETVEGIAEIINRQFSTIGTPEDPAEQDEVREPHVPNLPRINYEKLEFGDNYRPGKKKE